MRRLVDTRAAAALTDRPPGTIGRWASTGLLRHHGYDDKGRALFDLAEVDALAKGRPVTACLARCTRPAQVDAPVALCRMHLDEVYLYVSDELATAVPTVEPARRGLGQHDPLVYFVQSGDLVKIGTTRTFLTRLQALQPEKVLGTVPGGYREEAQAHQAWRHLRARGEWFHVTDELLAWIAAVVTDTTDPRTKESAA